MAMIAVLAVVAGACGGGSAGTEAGSVTTGAGVDDAADSTVDDAASAAGGTTAGTQAEPAGNGEEQEEDEPDSLEDFPGVGLDDPEGNAAFSGETTTTVVGWPAPKGLELGVAESSPPGVLPVLRELWLYWDGYGYETVDVLSAWHVQVRRNGVVVWDYSEFGTLYAGHPEALVQQERSEGVWDVPAGIYTFRVAGVHPETGRGEWSEWSPPLDVPFLELVASPFTKGELDYLNALSVAEVLAEASGLVGELGLGEATRVSEEGLDLGGDGYTDVGWENLTYLDGMTTAVELGEAACVWRNPFGLSSDARLYAVLRFEGSIAEPEREAVAAVAGAYLC